MATTSGELREMLIEAIDAVRAKKLEPEGAKSIAMLAQQVNASLAAEVMARREEKQITGGRVAMIGQLVLGELQEKTK